MLQRRGVKDGVGQQTLQSRVLVLKCIETAGLRHIHPAEVRLPVVDRGVADLILAAQVGNENPAL
jgi:hypothetical protein